MPVLLYLPGSRWRWLAAVQLLTSSKGVVVAGGQTVQVRSWMVTVHSGAGFLTFVEYSLI